MSYRLVNSMRTTALQMRPQRPPDKSRARPGWRGDAATASGRRSSSARADGQRETGKLTDGKTSAGDQELDLLRARIAVLESEQSDAQRLLSELDQLQRDNTKLRETLEQSRAAWDAERARLQIARKRLAAALVSVREEKPAIEHPAARSADQQRAQDGHFNGALRDSARAEATVAQLTEQVDQLATLSTWTSRQLAALIENEAAANAALARKDKANEILRARIRGLITVLRSLQQGRGQDLPSLHRVSQEA